MHDSPEGQYRFKEARIASRMPLLAQLLQRVDSREIFTITFARLLRLAAHIGLALAALVWLRSLGMLADLPKEAPIVTALLVQVLGLGALVYVWAVIIARAERLAARAVSNVITIMLRIGALAAEVVAVLGLSGVALMAVAKILSGPKGEEAFALGAVALPTQGWHKLFDSTSGSESAVELSSRLNGVGMLLLSVVVGFGLLLVGYVLNDWFKLVYQFLLRKDEAE